MGMYLTFHDCVKLGHDGKVDYVKGQSPSPVSRVPHIIRQVQTARPCIAWSLWRCLPAMMLACLLAACSPPGVMDLLKGQEQLDKGELDLAILSLRTATETMPQSARAWNYLGLAYHQDGQLISARDAYTRALNTDNNLAAARFNLGCLLLENKQFAPALNQFKTFQMLSPQASMVQPYKALAHLGNDELEPSEAIFDMLLRQNPKLPIALNGKGMIQFQKGIYREAYDYFHTALEQDNSYLPALWNQGTVAYPSLKRPDLAVKKLREYTFKAPKSPLASQASGIANDLEERLLAKAPPEKPKQANDEETDASAENLANEQVEVPYQEIESLPVAENQPTPIHQPAPTQHEMNPMEKENAENVASSVSVSPAEDKPTTGTPTETEQAEPSTPAVKPILAAELGTTINEEIVVPKQSLTLSPGQKPLEEEFSSPGIPAPSQPGITPLPEGTPFNPYRYLLPGAPAPGDRNVAASWFEKGNRAHQRQDFDRSIAAYEKAVSADPSYFEAYFNLGLAALKGGNPSKALSAYEWALAIQPNHRDSRYNLALGLQQSGHYRDAARELENLLKRDKNDTQVMMRLGDLYAGPLQRPVRTREIYRQLLNRNPDPKNAATAQRWLRSNP
jgi:tetratricopeptide (TPR) repeat protein